MKAREKLTGTDLITAFIVRRVLPLQQRIHLIGQMTGLQDPNRMLAADQVARRVNDISKANLGVEWEFGKAPYSHANPAPLVSPWSPYFAAAYLLVRPDATREVLLYAVRHPYNRAWAQVVRVASEEPEAHGGGEVAAADTGTGRRAGMLTRAADVAAPGGGGGGAAGVGSSQGPATTRRPHGKDSVPPRAPSAKRTADPAGGAKPPAKRRRGAPQERAERPAVLVVPGSPISLALAAADPASAEGAVFRRSRSCTVDRDEEVERADPADAEGLAWRDQNRAEAELEAASTQAWVCATTARSRDAVLEEAARAAPEGASRMPMSEAPPVVEPQTAPPTEPASVLQRALEKAPASGEAAGGEHALVLRLGGRRVAEPRPSQSGASEQLDSYRVTVFNRLLETQRCLKERLAAKEEELRVTAAEMLSWRTRLIWAGFHYDRLVADVGRLGAEVEKAKAEATGARQALDKASRLWEQLAGDKSRLEAEVERLKAEAAKVVEAQQALAEADQQRGKLADDKGQLQTEVERVKALVATTEETRLGETRLCEEAVKEANDKDAELKAALAKVADLEKALEEHDRTIARERRGTLLEAQHLEESFSRAFLETRQLAEEAVRFQRDLQGIIGSETGLRVA
nr:uncharacterized protein LOC120964969 [Aegilops tauschii subsp. strangulata]